MINLKRGFIYKLIPKAEENPYKISINLIGLLHDNKLNYLKLYKLFKFNFI